MRIYCDSTDLYAVKCDCGRRTSGFTTIAGASHSWNYINKKNTARESTGPTSGKEIDLYPIIRGERKKSI